jgi:lipoprotein-anchoring transpeptidase ErfK/SrfK
MRAALCGSILPSPKMKAALAVSAVLLVLLGGGVGALYAYDSSREDLIAGGVTIAGVDVGGLEVDEARALIRRAVVRRLDRPLLLRHDGEGVRLVSAKKLQVSVDVDGMVEEALARSREGSLFARTFRDLTGGDLEARIGLRATYSRKEVSALFSRVERALFRAPKEARIIPSAGTVRTVSSRNGQAVLVGKLERTVIRDLVQPTADGIVEVPTRVLKPKVTTADLRAKYPFFITVSRSGFQLRLYERLELAKTYAVSIGQVGYDTPTGLYRIKTKAGAPAWYVPNEPWAGDLAGKVIPPGPDNPIKARWMGIHAGAGIHGTDDVDSIGQAASHGCIRMRIPDVIELYNTVPVRTPVFIG